MAESALTGVVAPVQVPRRAPSLARTRETVPFRLGAQMSSPSETGYCTLPLASVVTSRTFAFWGVQNWFNAARRLPRFNTESTERERKAAICRRETFPAGS